MRNEALLRTIVCPVKELLFCNETRPAPSTMRVPAPLTTPARAWGEELAKRRVEPAATETAPVNVPELNCAEESTEKVPALTVSDPRKPWLIAASRVKVPVPTLVMPPTRLVTVPAKVEVALFSPTTKVGSVALA